MSVNINTFKLFTEFCSNKNQQGGTLTITQFNELCNRAQMSKFESDFQTFIATEQISEYLKTFLKNQVVSVPANGQIPYPSDFEHMASVRKYYAQSSGQGVMLNVDEVNNASYGLAQTSSLARPSSRFPKYSEFSTTIRFLPKSIGIVEYDYFRTPVAPFWGFTVVSGRPVYNAGTSVNFEWSDAYTNEIAGIFLSMIGINLLQGDLVGWSNQFKEINKSIV